MLAALKKHKRVEPINGFNEPHLFGFMNKLGYTQGAPSPEAAEIDEGVVMEQPCNECGYKHTKYLPFTRGESYRAFALCLGCGYYEEF